MKSGITHRLGDIADVQQGYTFKPGYQGQSSGEWIYVKVADIGSPASSKYLRKSQNYVSSEVLREMRATPFPAGSIVFPRVGAALRNNNKRILAENSLTDDNVIVVTVRDTQICDPEYLYYWFDFHDLQDFCNAGTVPVINGRNLKIQEVMLPSIAIQRVTASALSTWDAALEKIQRLIDAKERRHRGLLIRLLGKRLWSDCRHERADALFASVSERNQPELPVLAVTQDQGVVPRTMLDRRITMELSDPANFKVVRKDDFVISLRSFQGGLEHSEYDGLVSPAYTVLRGQPALYPPFYRHYLKSPDFLKRLAVAVVGIRDGKQIAFTDFASIKLPLPAFDLQTKIAAVLDESEDEIALMKQQAGKLRTQKRGLMQKLLTGKWRVPVPEEAVV
ncbi:restriction endonuclease subunit S [Burkholderia thailandensis]|uniref:restriction endonuclease subunit S n=1 Tax=Burkholderia thailandensis TaxID=57975 RepID=UPI00016A8EDE|nr:restriction endonuclease subunit S [Burkholderia thailandensis]